MVATTDGEISTKKDWVRPAAPTTKIGKKELQKEVVKILVEPPRNFREIAAPIYLADRSRRFCANVARRRGACCLDVGR